MGYMLDNTMLRLTWSTGNDGGAVRTFTLPEPDRIDYREHLATLEGERVLVITREWSEDGEDKGTSTEVVAGVSPVYVANVLDYWGTNWSDDGGEHYSRDGEDTFYTAGYGRPATVSARYSARLIGFRPRELAAIYRAVNGNGSDGRLTPPVPRQQ